MLEEKPRADQLEVSIFGPGIGECVVVHLGNGRWMVVDSCVSRGSARPVALEYFEKLGVRPEEDVAVVAVTHWHDDHTAGVAAVLAACTNATFFCSAALGVREFAQLVASARQLELRAGEGSGVDEMQKVFAVLAERRRRSDGQVVSPSFAAANTVVYRSMGDASFPPCTVEALSPSSATMTRGMVAAVPRLGTPKRRIPNPGPNELSVAMHIQFGETAALLGADLEVGTSNTTGWRAVVRNARNPVGKAAIVKVPHHGSSGADHPDTWKTLVADAPHVGVTPFTSSRLPRQTDIARLRTRAGALFHASPAKAPLVKLDRTSARTLAGITLRERRGAMGHIRFRVSGHDVTTETFGASAAI